MEYTGGRTKDAIVSWVLKKSGPPSTEADCDALKKKVADNKFVMAYFGAEDSDLFKKYYNCGLTRFYMRFDYFLTQRI